MTILVLARSARRGPVTDDVHDRPDIARCHTAWGCDPAGPLEILMARETHRCPRCREPLDQDDSDGAGRCTHPHCGFAY